MMWGIEQLNSTLFDSSMNAHVIFCNVTINGVGVVINTGELAMLRESEFLGVSSSNVDLFVSLKIASFYNAIMNIVFVVVVLFVLIGSFVMFNNDSRKFVVKPVLRILSVARLFESEIADLASTRRKIKDEEKTPQDATELDYLSFCVNQMVQEVRKSYSRKSIDESARSAVPLLNDKETRAELYGLMSRWQATLSTSRVNGRGRGFTAPSRNASTMSARRSRSRTPSPVTTLAEAKEEEVSKIEDLVAHSIRRKRPSVVAIIEEDDEWEAKGTEKEPNRRFSMGLSLDEKRALGFV